MRKRRAQERELADVHALVRAWYQWHRELCDEALAGPSGALVEQLLEILRELTLRDGAALVAFARSQSWCDVDRDTRDICLFAIDGCITKLRERNGMHPFDDPLPDQPPNIFLTIKEIVLFPSPDGRSRRAPFPANSVKEEN